MDPTLVFAAISLSLGDDGVERAAPGRAPTAFRIWRAGANATDMGDHVFSEKSAKLLMAQQAIRGNKYSIDADHMSLNSVSPPESRKAVGWHELAVRPGANGPELWAVNVQWTDAVRSGLEKDPPEWRYFSPAYKLAKDGNEIVSYLNTALTNNPATHSVTELATLQAANATTRASMDYKEMAAAFFGKDEEKKQAAKDCYSKMSEGERKAFKAAWKAAEGDFGDDGGGEEKKKDEAAKAAAAEDEKKKEEAKKASEAEAEKKKGEEAKAASAIAANALEMAKELQELKVWKSQQEAEAVKRLAAEQRATIMAKRPDLSAAQVAVLEYVPLADLPKHLEALPRVTASAGSSAAALLAAGNVSGGERHSGGNPTLGRLTADERSMLASVHANAPPTGDIVRATRRGTTLEMPMHIPTPIQITNRIKELETQLAAHRAEYLQ